MTYLTDPELEIYKKYKKSTPIDKEDKNYILNQCLVGEFTLGFGTERCGTARLTSQGLYTLRQEEIERSPLKQFLHGLASLIIPNY